MQLENFEIFKSTGAKLANGAISISRALGFGFNSGFYHKNGIKNYKYVVLMYNRQDDAIGFLFTNEQKPGAFKITHASRGTSASIVAVSFFANYQLRDNIDNLAGKYQPDEIQNVEGGVGFYINLKEKK